MTWTGAKLRRGVRFLLLASMLLVGLSAAPVNPPARAQDQEEPPPTPPDPFVSRITFTHRGPHEVIVFVDVQNQGDRASGFVFLNLSWELLGTEHSGSFCDECIIFSSITGNLQQTFTGSKSFNIDKDLEGDLQGAEGLYRITASLRVEGEDSDPNNNTRSAEVPIYSKPELRISGLEFSPPPPFVPGLIDRAAIAVTVQNTGLQAGFSPTQVKVTFSVCPRGGAAGRETCRELPEVLMDVPRSDPNDIKISSALVRTAQGSLPHLPVSELSPGLYELQVDVDPENRLEELDDDNGQAFPFQVLGEGPQPTIPTIRYLVVGPNGVETSPTGRAQGEGKPGVLFLAPTDSELWALDKLTLERWVSCVGPAIQVCPYGEGSAERAQIARFVTFSPQPGAPVFGQARVDVLGEAFDTFNANLPPSDRAVLNKWRLESPTRITSVAQDQRRRILYVGLSNGQLWRIRFERPQDLRALAVPETINVESGAQISALRAVRTFSQGENVSAVIIGTARPSLTDPNARGNVYFLHENDQVPDRLSSGTTLGLGAVEQITSIQVDKWVFIAASDRSFATPSVQVWWTRNRTLEEGGPTPLDTSAQLNLEDLGGGVFNRFVAESVGGVPWLYIATSSDQQSSLLNVYQLNIQQTFRRVGGRFVLEESIDPDVQPLTSFAISGVRDRLGNFSALGLVQDMTVGRIPGAGGGLNVLYLGNRQGQTLVIRTHRAEAGSPTFEGVLEDRVDLRGGVRAIEVDVDEVPGPSGLEQTGPSGLLLVGTDEEMFLVDERDPTRDTLKALSSRAPVLARPHSETRSSASSFILGETKEIIVIYASDALYFWLADKETL